MFRFAGVIVVALLALALGSGNISSASRAAPKKVALLVGVNQYAKRGLDDKPLKYAERDVEALAVVLAKQGFEVRLLKGSGRGDEQATLANIQAALGQLLKGRDGQDVVLIGLAGHGVQMHLVDEKGTYQKDARGEYLEDAYFCPVDAKLTEPQSLLSLTRLMERLNEDGGINLILVDACRDDPDRSARSITGNELNGRLPKNTAMFFSCAARQQALETDQAGGGHGVFFYHVLEGLKGKAADSETGEVDWNSLVGYVQRRVNRQVIEWFPERAKAAQDGQVQTPHEFRNLIRIPVLARIEPERGSLPEIPMPLPDIPAPKPKVPAPLPDPPTGRSPLASAGKLNVEVTEANGVDVVLGSRTIGRATRGTKLEVTKTNGPWFRVDIPAGAGWIPATAVRFASTPVNNSLGMEFVWIPPGEFTMGSPAGEADRDADEVEHKVTLTQGYWLGVYEVTQGEYQQVMGKDKVPRFDTPRFPVEQVSWDDVQEFCQKLSARDGHHYRLPTEAQWEYACRAGTTTAFSFGATGNGREANCNGNYPYGTSVKGPYRGGRTDVGSYRQSSFGLYDMHGNVREWCSDWYGDSLGKASVTDPTGPALGSRRVSRGGGWDDSPRNVRSAARRSDDLADRYFILGFRVAVVQ